MSRDLIVKPGKRGKEYLRSVEICSGLAPEYILLAVLKEATDKVLGRTKGKSHFAIKRGKTKQKSMK